MARAAVVAVSDLTPRASVEREPGPDSTASWLANWYWLPASDGTSRLACAIAEGSNFVEFQYLHGDRNYTGSKRVHVDELHDVTPATAAEAEAHIAAMVKHHQGRHAAALAELRALVGRLGLTQDSSTSTALVPAGAGGVDPAAYEGALVTARDETLPALRETMRQEQEYVTTWLAVRTWPARAVADSLAGAVATIDDRLLSLSLYAGLGEHVEQFADGTPAPVDTPITIMQRKLFMDEECLLHIQDGGMEFRRLGDFMAWLAVPANRDRLLPAARCITAMQVRRHRKERMPAGGSVTIAQLHQLLRDEETDRYTYLMIRNGERLYCLATDIEFDSLLFPAAEALDPTSQQLYYKAFGSAVDSVIGEHEYNAMRAEADRKAAAADDGRPGLSASYYLSRVNEWSPVNDSDPYFDDVQAYIAREIKRYNRVAVIVQGLLDRSDVFAPNPGWQTWKAEGFAAAIRLRYDATGALVYGEAPDFEAYRARLNSQAGHQSVWAGQRARWRDDGENRRDWRGQLPAAYYLSKGPDDPGPAAVWRPRKRTATFRWERERATPASWRSNSDTVRESFTCDAGALLNVSAYRPGDYLQFFRDARTREDYLQWAPLLLAAEDWHAGRLKPRGDGRRKRLP